MTSRPELLPLGLAAARLGYTESELRTALVLGAGVLRVGHVVVQVGAARQLAPAEHPEAAAGPGGRP